MNNRRWGRRVTYRPSRANGVLGMVSGAVFVLIGIFVIIPGAGAFGALWTAMAAAITVYNAYVVFGKKYIGPEIRIEDEDGGEGQDEPEERLRKLRELYDQRLITVEEYEEKRKKIIDGI